MFGLVSFEFRRWIFGGMREKSTACGTGFTAVQNHLCTCSCLCLCVCLGVWVSGFVWLCLCVCMRERERRRKRKKLRMYFIARMNFIFAADFSRQRFLRVAVCSSYYSSSSSLFCLILFFNVSDAHEGSILFLLIFFFVSWMCVCVLFSWRVRYFGSLVKWRQRKRMTIFALTSRIVAGFA